MSMGGKTEVRPISKVVSVGLGDKLKEKGEGLSHKQGHCPQYFLSAFETSSYIQNFMFHILRVLQNHCHTICLKQFTTS